MNLYLKAICILLSLGQIEVPEQQVYGGLINKMWHVRTETGEYAVKELNLTSLENPDATQNYEFSEKVAQMFSDHGIPALTTYKLEDKSVIQINKNGFMVYPWVEGISEDSINKSKAQKIGETLAQMHSLKLSLPEVENMNSVEAMYAVYSDKHCQELLNRVIEINLSFSKNIKDLKEQLLSWYQNYKNSIPMLNQDLALTHGDLNTKNVLWNTSNEPIIIDWETACMLNPTQELMYVALDWSGFSECNIDFELYKSVVNGYKNKGMISKNYIESAYDFNLGIYINWLFFNIKRCLDNISEDEYTLGIDQVEHTLKWIDLLVSNKEEIIKYII